MENYKLLQRMGKGAQGSVFLVEDRRDQAKYVLKKVECSDEGEANKAFKEAMALQELQHPYVCGYKEFFVTWDKEEATMYVCIVMDYYKMGDLDRVLKQKRTKGEKVDELILKKWFGQMLEALVFVHKKKVIHRDLKPSNIFITSDLNISVGDFGVATVMGDARTSARTTKHALKDIEKEYSVDICHLIRTMLRRNFQQRPTAIELVEIPFVKNCLALSGSELAGKKKEKQKNSKSPDKGASVADTIKFMKENKDNGISVANALRHLNTLNKPQLDESSRQLVVKSMKENMSEVDVQTEACKLILTLAAASDIEEDTEDFLFSSEVIATVSLVMQSHASSRELQGAACLLLKTLALSEDAAGKIGLGGGIQDILSAMRSFPGDATIAANCASALSCLTINDKNIEIMREEKGVMDLMNVMREHGSSASVIDFACSALWGLSLEDENVEMMTDAGATDLLLDALKTHQKNADVAKNACMALASLVGESEACAYSILNSSEGGMETVCNAYRSHKDNPDVVENVACFFMELSEIDDMIDGLKSCKVDEIMKEARVKHASNEEIMGYVQSVLAKLGVGKAPASRPVSARVRNK
ncbi:serine/threonine kinase-like domain-containing protein STKLD1 [Anneissia japonica]|uniref:serine/threonine kinase-like domain-containing protein STKLD1 n=1 Tax=Anneissia japonica TaxID=1529436 RepID=UPI0014257F5C|nr:serine/threonine kinase-like domain-containing protein STKLD1 [Anneissia japonica]